MWKHTNLSEGAQGALSYDDSGFKGSRALHVTQLFRPRVSHKSVHDPKGDVALTPMSIAVPLWRTAYTVDRNKRRGIDGSLFLSMMHLHVYFETQRSTLLQTNTQKRACPFGGS